MFFFRSCPAFVVAEERSLNNVIITAAFLQHNHPWSGPIAGVNNRVPEDSYKKVTVAPPLTPPPVLQPAEPFDMQDDNVEPSTPTTPTNFFQELKRVYYKTSSIWVFCNLKIPYF